MRIHLFYIFLLSLSINIFSIQTSFAKEKRYSIKVYGMDNKIKKGVLESVDDKGIYVVPKIGGTPYFIESTQIKLLKLRRKNKSGTGSTIGFALGIGAGVSGYTALNGNDNLVNTLYAVSGVVVTYFMTAIGGAIGSQYDETFQINGRSEDYLQTLQTLKSFTPLSSQK